ncbi:hypothetical protein K2173_009660 [Erythroxylum novogranatense]|uniref:Myb/SANT-like DNA-binding domain-containing protein n=1 Tax=Erythroxylum novogranatense TaxID=1862640 RepID=A0AAV8U7R4_9ROSI|nr:hypothetical protein K2173_009660 [Erythroxylum novogranatense]
MDKETNHDTPSLLSNHNTTIKEDSPRKHLGGGAVANVGLGGGGDRLKRDEWSEGAVSTLLEAYENKWILRNRAKLKGHDWEDVARYVSSRANSTKSSKTQTQCKNKIESMKKRYRSESATADASSWPLYPRLDLLLRGSSTAPPPPQSQQQQSSLPPSSSPHLMLLESSPMTTTIPATIQVPVAPIPVTVTAQNSHGSNGVDKRAKNEGVLDAKLSDHVSEQNAIDTDSSTPALLHSDNERLGSKKMKMKVDQKKKKRRREELEISDSIRWLAEVVVRSEQARMETMRELEKMRIEAEAKRGEMDLKRTEIIANTQLEIAKIFATAGKGVDSSLRIGRS